MNVKKQSGETTSRYEVIDAFVAEDGDLIAEQIREMDRTSSFLGAHISILQNTGLAFGVNGSRAANGRIDAAPKY